MKKETVIKKDDLVVVVDDFSCNRIKNGDIHQVEDVCDDKITLVGKGGTQYFAERFKKVYERNTTSPETELEDVLKIDITKIDDKYSYAKIAYQNFDILKRRDFVDSEINVESFGSFEFNGVESRLFLCGSNLELDDMPIIIENDLIEELNRRIDAINKKYGIKKKWRAKKYDVYWYVDEFGLIEGETDIGCHSDDMRFEARNYFKTEEDAKTSAIYKAFHGEL